MEKITWEVPPELGTLHRHTRLGKPGQRNGLDHHTQQHRTRGVCSMQVVLKARPPSRWWLQVIGPQAEVGTGRGAEHCSSSRPHPYSARQYLEL